MRINTRLTQSDYQKLMFALSYKNKLMIFLMVVGILNIIAAGLYFAGIRWGNGGTQQPLFSLLFGLAFTFGFPLMIYRNAAKSYKTNSRMQEKLVYDITEDKLEITGETFQTEKEWSNTYMIRELKKFFLVYETNFVANIIPKSQLTEDECNQLSDIFSRIKTKYPEIK